MGNNAVMHDPAGVVAEALSSDRDAATPSGGDWTRLAAVDVVPGQPAPDLSALTAEVRALAAADPGLARRNLQRAYIAPLLHQALTALQELVALQSTVAGGLETAVQQMVQRRATQGTLFEPEGPLLDSPLAFTRSNEGLGGSLPADERQQNDTPRIGFNPMFEAVIAVPPAPEPPGVGARSGCSAMAEDENATSPARGEADAVARAEAQVAALLAELESARAKLIEIGGRAAEPESPSLVAATPESDAEAQPALASQERPSGEPDAVSSQSVEGRAEEVGSSPSLGERSSANVEAIAVVHLATAAGPPPLQAGSNGPALQPGETPPGVQAGVQASPVGAVSTPGMRLDIRPATPLTGTAVIASVAAPNVSDRGAASGPQYPSAHSAEQVRRPFDEMDRDKIPVPKPVDDGPVTQSPAIDERLGETREARPMADTAAVQDAVGVAAEARSSGRNARAVALVSEKAEALAKARAEVQALRMELEAARTMLAEVSGSPSDAGSASTEAGARAVVPGDERSTGQPEAVLSQSAEGGAEAGPSPPLVERSPASSEAPPVVDVAIAADRTSVPTAGNGPAPQAGETSSGERAVAQASPVGADAGPRVGKVPLPKPVDDGLGTQSRAIDDSRGETGEARRIVVGAKLGAPSEATTRVTEATSVPIAEPPPLVSGAAVGSVSAPPVEPEGMQIPQTSAEFAALVRKVEDAARDWDVRPDTAEGRLVSAMMAGIGWVGRVSEAAQKSFGEIADKHRASAELELSRAKEITKTVTASLVQSRNAMINLQVERETVVARMMTDTMPMFADRLKDAVVIREKSELEGTRFKRFVMSCLVALGVFLGGYAVRAWADSAEVGALGRCLTHPLYVANHAYCEIGNFAPVVPKAP